jgi:hypothetical protein
MKKYDKHIALVFGMLSVLFLILIMTDSIFFEWVFKRHQNQMSWYIRPIFLIPFCYFAYKHSLAGISLTIFCIFTSMFWFNTPEIASDKVNAFLQFEKDWLHSTWDFQKVILILTVPMSFAILALAFWQRSLWIGLTVVILMATGKIFWSIFNTGELGKSIIIPAVIGLVICFGLICFGFKRLEK